MMPDLRGKFVHLSDVMAELPTVKKMLSHLLVVSVAAGFLIHFLLVPDLFSALWRGALEGFSLLFVPAVLSAALVSRAFRQKAYAYILATSLASTVVVALVYVGGFFAFSQLNVGLAAVVLLANAFAVLVWFLAVHVVLGVKTPNALAAALVPAVFNFSAVVAWNVLGFAQSVLPLDVSAVTLVRFAVSTGILLLALGALFYVINAPSRRNFGVPTMTALSLFFAQWIQGDKGLEDFLARFGEKLTTWIGLVSFRTKKGKLKSLFLVPHVHYGPFGNLGGSALPAYLSLHFQKKTGANTFVFHPMVTHDMNPVHSGQSHQFARVFESLLASAPKGASRGFMSKTRVGEVGMAACGFGKNAFLTFTRAPHSTEDFDLAAGLALRNLALRRFDDALVVDRHNSLTDGAMYDVGSDVYNRYVDAILGLAPGKAASLSLGTASDSLADFTVAQGIGGGGLKAAVFGFGKKRACIVWVDGNNATPDFRDKVRARLSRLRFDFVDLFTTDTHAVNTIGGIHNPVGANLDADLLLNRIEKVVLQAERDVEPVSAAFSTRRISVSVLGIQRQSQLVSTINAIVSVAKIAAPVMFLLSLVLVLLAFLYLV